MTQIRYIIIIPSRNEETYIEATIASITRQTIRPARCIIVDDGSSDGTGRIIDAASRRYSWIIPFHRSDRGVRRAGGGVMEAFYEGFELVRNDTWDYVVKLDGDVTFEPDYFERCFGEFFAEPRLGIGGGLICNLIGGSLLPESKSDPKFHVRGATKIYRNECWRAIGGLIRETGWDTVDELKANMLGWTTRSFPDIKIVHHRPAGGAYGTWPNWVKNGFANYVSGYHPVFMFLKCAKRIFQKPYGIGALGLFTGFCLGYIKRLPQIYDPELIHYLRREQMKRLFGRNSLWG